MTTAAMLDVQEQPIVQATGAMLDEPLLISKNCLNRSICAISRGLIRSPNSCGGSLFQVVLYPIKEQKKPGVGHSRNTVTKAKPKNELNQKTLSAEKINGHLDDKDNQNQQKVPKKSCEMDNGELIELLKKNRQHSQSSSRKLCRRTMSVDVASLGRSSDTGLKEEGHFLVNYQRNIARLSSDY